MAKRIFSLVFIFFCTTVAWIILGAATSIRTFEQDSKIRGIVSQLWGTVQKQQAPEVFYETKKEKEIKTIKGNETVLERGWETTGHPLQIDGSDIFVEIELNHRKKGLLWYSTYLVKFSGKYRILNHFNENMDIFFSYKFPTEKGVYDNFSLLVDGKRINNIQPESGRILEKINFEPNEEKIIEISYKSQGMDEWWYVFGENVSQIQNFKLTMNTNFSRIDFPENSISPTKKEKKDKGWQLTWQYSNLISGIQIGIKMQKKLNPGPFVSRVSFFAPVSFFFFFFIMFLITLLRKINIHPMNYFFIAAAFFSFHLLMAYLVDHIDLYLSFLISSIVSIFLVISYIRLVVGLRFALVETGISQFIYLVLFSYAFLLEGYTGLTITILSILTLFIIMQFTGRIDWEKHLSDGK